MNPHAVSIVAVGDELLDGRTRETNSHWLLERLAVLGVAVDGVEVVGDQLDAIVGAMQRAARRSGCVLITGGLGPTRDDRTREAMAAFAGLELVLDDLLLEQIRARFESRAKSMPAGNERQAMRPRGARAIANPVGTAPGVELEVASALLVLMPGVPREMHRMWEDHVEARVRERCATGRTASLRLRLARSGESAIAARVEEWLGGRSEIEAAYCVNDWGVDVLLRGPSEAALRAQAASLEQLLAPRVYHVGDRGLPELLLDRLRARAASLAVAESCSGGLLAGALTEVPGSSDVFRGGVIAYADDLKLRVLGVAEQSLAEHGAVSREVAEEMASGARGRFASDFALATTGIAGPGGGSVEKPVGTIWIAVAGPDGVRSELLRLFADRAINRRQTVAAALDLLRLELGDGRLDA